MQGSAKMLDKLGRKKFGLSGQRAFPISRDSGKGGHNVDMQDRY